MNWRIWLGTVAVIAAVSMIVWLAAAIAVRLVRAWELSAAKRKRDQFDLAIERSRKELERRRQATLRAYEFDSTHWWN